MIQRAQCLLGKQWHSGSEVTNPHSPTGSEKEQPWLFTSISLEMETARPRGTIGGQGSSLGEMTPELE